MKNIFLRILRGCVLCACLLLQATAWADAHSQQLVDKFVQQPQFTHASLSICVQDLQNGELVAEHAKDKALLSASTMKTVTCATALAMLGDDYRFHTQVKLVGEQKADTFYGDVVLIGGGDPTLGSVYFPKQRDFFSKIVDALEDKGIKNIVGRLQVDKGAYSSFGHSLYVSIGDPGNDYGAGVYGLNYKDNLLDLSIGSSKGALRAELNRKYAYKIINDVRTGKIRDIDVLPYPADKPVFLITGEQPPNSKSKVYYVGNPMPEVELFADLEQNLANRNIKFTRIASKPTKDKGELLLDFVSPRLADIVHSLLVRSDNMYADALLLELAKANKMAPLRSNGAAVVKEYWKKQGIDCASLFMKDGSGLSRRNYVSSYFMTQMLAKAEQEKGLSNVALSELMPKLGKDLYMSKQLTLVKLGGNSISAKSGSMTGVQCFVGYYPADKPRYSWGVMVNNYQASNQEIRDEIAKLLVELFRGK